MAKQVADAHENATRQAICPSQMVDGGHSEMENRKKKLSHRQGEKDYLVGHRYLLRALQNSSCLVSWIPKRGFDLNAHLPTSLSNVSFILSLLFWTSSSSVSAPASALPSIKEPLGLLSRLVTFDSLGSTRTPSS